MLERTIQKSANKLVNNKPVPQMTYLFNYTIIKYIVNAFIV